jgi:predicted dehydrogenase
VGTGAAGRRHLETLRALGVDDLVAVNEHRPGPPLEVDGASVVTVHSFADALGGGLDAVVIANPTSMHASYAERAVLADVPVLCEKPLAADAASAERVRAAAAARAVPVAVCCQFRFHEQLVELREQLRDGGLGRVVDVDATQGEHLADYHPDEDYRTSYAARAELGGGVLLTQVHLVDLVHWLVGPFVRAYAVGGRRTNLELDVEDSASFVLETASGVAVRGHLDYFRRPRRFTVDVTGTEGNASWDYYAGVLAFEGRRAGTDARPFDRLALFRATVADFLDAVRDGRPARASAGDAVAVLSVVDAIRRSMRSGTAEPIEPAPADPAEELP